MGVAKCQTWLSDFTFTFHFHALKKEMATHSSVLAWRIPGMGEPGGLLSMGPHRVGHNWSDLAAAAAAGWLHIQFFFLFFKNKLTKCFPGWLYCFTSPPAMGEGSSFSESSPACSVLSRWCDPWPRARHLGMWSQVGLRKHHYEQS